MMTDTIPPYYPWLDWDECFNCEAIDSGWHDLIDDFFKSMDALFDSGSVRLEIYMIREKFGRLCVFYELFEASYAEEEAVIALYHVAQDRSETTCLKCGLPGRLRKDRPRFVPLCDLHA